MGKLNNDLPFTKEKRQLIKQIIDSAGSIDMDEILYARKNAYKYIKRSGRPMTEDAYFKELMCAGMLTENEFISSLREYIRYFQLQFCKKYGLKVMLQWL